MYEYTKEMPILTMIHGRDTACVPSRDVSIK